MSLLEEACPRGRLVNISSLPPHPVCSLCFMLALEDRNSWLPVPPPCLLLAALPPQP